MMIASRRPVAALLVAALLLACSPADPDADASSGADGSVPPSAGSGAPAPTDAPSAVAEATPGPGEFANPVLENFPDPDVIQVGDTFYAYATTNYDPGTGRGSNIQVARSDDLVTWERLEDALPELAAWSGLTTLFQRLLHAATWAPDVAIVGDRYLMYYTTPAVDIPRPDGKPAQCLSVATAEAPEGPFVDASEAPLVCQADLGGSIDGSHFVDEDGTQYFVWKNDGNCCGQPTNFWLQELAPDGLSVIGEPLMLEGLDNDTAWEGRVIESPQLLVHEGRYYMFFSGNDFASVRYAVGYATAEALTGPYTDAEENPILFTEFDTAAELGLAGPGHQSIFTDADGDLWMAYHAWPNTAIGDDSVGRHLWLDELRFEDGRPVVDGPDPDPQPAP
jgi:beta-xylosidase